MRRIAFLPCLLLAMQNARASNYSSEQKQGRDFRPPGQIARIEKYTFPAGSAGSQRVLAAGRRGRKSEIQSSNPLKKRKIALFSSFRLELDDIDRLIVWSTLPLSAVFAIIPLSQALDLFWVNRLGDALAVAGQAAANQVFNSAFWLFSFLPSVTATLVSKSHASGDIEATQDAVCQALLFASVISIAGTSFMFMNPVKALSSILKGTS